jgi:hypothetical protein
MGDSARLDAAPGTRRSGRVGRILASLFLGLILLWLGICAYRTLGIVIHGRALAADLRTLWDRRSEAAGFPLEALRQSRVQAGYLERDLAGLNRWASPPACWLGGLIKGTLVGRYGQLTCDGLGLASALTSVAASSLLEMESATEHAGDDADPIQAALSRLMRDHGRVAALVPAAERLGEAAGTLPGLPDSVRSLGLLAPGAIHALLIAPEMLGGNKSRVYLVVLQNTDELRATGGFIGSVIAVALQGHRMTSVQYLNSYDVEPRGAQLPEAPGPLAEYMAAPGLVFRDANWSPDFPTSAEVLAALYSTSHGPVDGIVATDSVLLQQAVSAIGPVPVAKYGITITGDNLMQVAQTYWENPLEGAPLSGRAADLQGWLEHRKDFGGDFVDAGRTFVSDQGPETWLDLARALLVGLDQGHLQVWSLTSSTAQQDLARAGWAGQVLSGPGDYLMVVDSNVGFNKADRNIERSYAYDLVLGTGQPRVTLTLTYTNTATAQLEGCTHEAQVLDSYDALTEQCYWNYVRILVPGGAELLDVIGTTYAIDSGVEAGRSFFGTMIVVPPSTTGTLAFVYRLPRETVNCTKRVCSYRLAVQKQAGTIAVPLRVGVDVLLEQAIVSGTDPVKGPVTQVTTQLQVDREISLHWMLPAD